MSLQLLLHILASSHGGPALNLNAITVSDATAGVTYAGLRLNRDGTVDERDTGGYYQVSASTDWIEASAQTASIGDSYEMKLVKSTGTSLSGGLTDDTWYTISSGREGYLSTSFGTKAYTGTLYVREIAVPANIVSCAVSLDVERL